MRLGLPSNLADGAANAANIRASRILRRSSGSMGRYSGAPGGGATMPDKFGSGMNFDGNRFWFTGDQGFEAIEVDARAAPFHDLTCARRWSRKAFLDRGRSGRF